MHSSLVISSDGDDDPGAAFRRFSPPENELATPLDLRVELLRTPDLVVALVGGSAYSTGVLLQVQVRVRPASLTLQQRRERAFGLPPFHHDVLVGMTLPGGAVVSTLGAEPWGPAGDRGPDEPLLVPHGSSSSDTGAETTVWLTPAPPPGRIGVVVAHPELGVGEVHAELDATAIADACARAVELWPWESTQVVEPDLRPLRDLEPGGWFDRHRTASPDGSDGPDEPEDASEHDDG